MNANAGRIFSGHAPQLFIVARNARGRAEQMVEEDPRVMPSDAIIAIVFAAFATEAFINELAEIADMHREAGHTLAALADVGREAEDSNAGVTLKFQVASIALAGYTLERGSQPFQDFATLIRLRNLLVHLKPSDRLGANLEILGPKELETFEQRGMTYPRGDVEMSWFDKLHAPRMAEWACRAALAIVRAVIDMLPADLPLPLSHVRDWWNNPGA